MPVYTYRGTNRGGSAVSGDATATNKAELQNILRRSTDYGTINVREGQGIQLPTFGRRLGKR